MSRNLSAIAAFILLVALHVATVFAIAVENDQRSLLPYITHISR